MRFPPLPHTWILTVPLPVILHVGAQHDSLAGAVAVAHMGLAIRHRLLSAEVLSDWTVPTTRCPSGICLCIHASDTSWHSIAAAGNCLSAASRTSPNSRAAMQERSIAAEKPFTGGESAESLVGSCPQQHTQIAAVSSLRNNSTGYYTNRATSRSYRMSETGSEQTIEGHTEVRATGDSHGGGLCCCTSHEVVECRQMTATEVSQCHGLCCCAALAQERQAVDEVSLAVTAAMQACSFLVPELQWTLVSIYLNTAQPGACLPASCSCSDADCCSQTTAVLDSESCSDKCAWCHPSVQPALEELLTDDEWMALNAASAIIIDSGGQGEQSLGCKLGCFTEAAGSTSSAAVGRARDAGKFGLRPHHEQQMTGSREAAQSYPCLGKRLSFDVCCSHIAMSRKNIAMSPNADVCSHCLCLS